MKTDIEYIKELGTRFKLYRAHAGITQQELSLKTGLSVRSISRFEQGEVISLDNFIKLIIAVGLS